MKYTWDTGVRAFTFQFAQELDEKKLRLVARPRAVHTADPRLVFHPKVASRSSQFTSVVWEYDEETRRLLVDVQAVASASAVYLVRRRVGFHHNVALPTEFVIAATHPELALMASANFFPPGETSRPSTKVLVLPSWPERRVLVLPHERLTLVLGIDYYGETKMAALRMGMHRAREELGMLGLHAGSKKYTLAGTYGGITCRGALFFGLSGTGKTTMVCADHGLAVPERVTMLQDDIVFLCQQGAAYGTERNFYVKTDSITQQPQLLRAASDRTAIAENVSVRGDGAIDFDDLSLGTNGRCIVPRNKIPSAGKGVDLPKVDCMFFLTRRDDMPPAARLVSPAQAAAFYMLGESVITSAEDPKRAGEARRTPGFDPFIVGDPAANGNRICEFIETNGIACYLLNTGRMRGEQGEKIRPEDTAACVEHIMRGLVQWRYDPTLGFSVATAIPGVALERFAPERFWKRVEWRKRIARLRKERLEYLAQFPNLRDDIKNAA